MMGVYQFLKLLPVLCDFLITLKGAFGMGCGKGECTISTI